MISADGKITNRRNVLIEKGDNTVNINLDGLPPGVYYLLGRNQKEKTNVLRFIKQ